jgi:hypothetical protein
MKMKKSIWFIALLLLFSAADAKIISARGDLIRREISVTDFRELDVRTQIDVYLRQGDRNEAVIESYESILDEVEYQEKNGKLLLRLNRSVRNINWMGKAKILRLYVTVRDLEKLELSGACDLYMQTPLKVNDLYLSASGASDLHMQAIRGDNVNVYCSGAGDMTDGEFEVESLHINNSGAIDSKLTVFSRRTKIVTSGASDVDLTIETDDLTINASGSSDYDISGKADQLKLNISGTTGVKAANLIVRDADIKASGTSDCHVHVSESLKVSSSGTASIYYRGRPERTSFNITGFSSVKSQ